MLRRLVTFTQSITIQWVWTQVGKVQDEPRTQWSESNGDAQGVMETYQEGMGVNFKGLPLAKSGKV